MTNDPNTEATQPSAPSPYERGAAEKPVETVVPEQLGAPAPAAETRVRHPRSPFDAASPKPDEIWREHENRVRHGLAHASIAEICAEWNCEVPLKFDAPADGTLS